MTVDGLMVIDVKTTSDASPEGFGKSSWNLGYHVQAAFYRRVIRGDRNYAGFHLRMC